MPSLKPWSWSLCAMLVCVVVLSSGCSCLLDTESLTSGLDLSYDRTADGGTDGPVADAIRDVPPDNGPDLPSDSKSEVMADKGADSVVSDISLDKGPDGPLPDIHYCPAKCTKDSDCATCTGLGICRHGACAAASCIDKITHPKVHAYATSLFADTSTFLSQRLDGISGMPEDKLLSIKQTAAPSLYCMIKEWHTFARWSSVFPQLPNVEIGNKNKFGGVEFVPKPASGAAPQPDDSLNHVHSLGTLRLVFDFQSGNTSGGVTIPAYSNLKGYRWAYIRYRNKEADDQIEFKVNSNPGPKEQTRLLPMTAAGAWKEHCIELPVKFDQVDLSKVNYFVFATSKSLSGTTAGTAIDRLSFHVYKPLASCTGTAPASFPKLLTQFNGKNCLDPKNLQRLKPENQNPCNDCTGTYQPLYCREPTTSVANVGLALTFLAADPSTPSTKNDIPIQRILTSLKRIPGWTGGASGTWTKLGWPQNWFGHVSLVPGPASGDRFTSLTDSAKLLAGLMVVHSRYTARLATKPSDKAAQDIVNDAAKLIAALDLSLFFDAKMQQLKGAHVRNMNGLYWDHRLLSTDKFLGTFLTLGAVGAADAKKVWQATRDLKNPASTGLACEQEQAKMYDFCKSPSPACCAGKQYYHHDPADPKWCTKNCIPGQYLGGAWVSSEALQFVDSGRLPLTPLSLARSSRNLMQTQQCFGKTMGLSLTAKGVPATKLPVWGWSNTRSPEAGPYRSESNSIYGPLTRWELVPYASILGLELAPTAVLQNLIAFEAAGLEAAYKPFSTGTRTHKYGLRSSYCLKAGASGYSAPHNYLVLDQGYIAAALINCLHGQRVRALFAAHQITKAAYSKLAAAPKTCPASKLVTCSAAPKKCP